MMPMLRRHKRLLRYYAYMPLLYACADAKSAAPLRLIFSPLSRFRLFRRRFHYASHDY